MGFVRFFIAISLVVSLTSIPSEAFVARLQPTRLIATELHLKRAVTDRYSFTKKATDGIQDFDQSAEDDEEVYHRRIVHFSEKSHEKDDQITTRKYRDKRSTDKTRSFGWDHRGFARSIDP
eukprot:62914_1